MNELYRMGFIVAVTLFGCSDPPTAPLITEEVQHYSDLEFSSVEDDRLFNSDYDPITGTLLNIITRKVQRNISDHIFQIQKTRALQLFQVIDGEFIERGFVRAQTFDGRSHVLITEVPPDGVVTHKCWIDTVHSDPNHPLMYFNFWVDVDTEEISITKTAFGRQI